MTGHDAAAGSEDVLLNHDDRHRRVTTVRRTMFAVLSAAILLLCVTSTAFATSSFYWYGSGGSTCWQTGQLGSPSEGCDSVGAGYLPTPGHHAGGLEHMVEGGISADLGLSSNGDYCNYYGVGDNLTLQISGNQGGATGYTTPEPFSSYQEGDANGSVCQANGSHWGQEVRSGVSGNLCGTGTCGMHHYASFVNQRSDNLPWSGVFGEPSLVISAEADVQTFTHSGTSYGGWGYVCPVLEDTEPSFHGVIEYCVEEWRSSNDASSWKGEGFGECGGSSAIIHSLFYSGTQYVTEMSGSANSTESAGNAHYEAKITRTNLINAVKLVNSNCAGWHLSENPENYALIGVEQGLEGWDGLTELAGSTGNLQLHTEYTPRPPSVTTTTPTAVQFRRAAANGTVNPYGSDTHYFFQYGRNTSYGSTTGEVDAGSGASAVHASTTISGLEPNTTYHYRIVASNAGGTTYGGDQEFTTAAPPNLTVTKSLQSSSSMTLTWTASTNAVSYTIKRDGVAVGSTAGLTYKDTNCTQRRSITTKSLLMTKMKAQAQTRLRARPRRSIVQKLT
jgi:hypothetical protein